MNSDAYAIHIKEAHQIFEGKVGAPIAGVEVEQLGTELFLSFIVGREAPIYVSALQAAQSSLSEDNPFRGRIRLKVRHVRKFPGSTEANCLLTLLARSTRTLTEGEISTAFLVPYVPFQNREDHVLSQPATHIVLGRRGVGKSTLIVRARDLLEKSGALSFALDMQAYSSTFGSDVVVDVLTDVASKLAEMADSLSNDTQSVVATQFREISHSLTNGDAGVQRVVPQLKRAISALSSASKKNLFIFLDDYHVLDRNIQPRLLHQLNGALKGASGWLKVAGVRSLLNYYSAADRVGLQIPGDAQEISLDLTLENPEAAERHLRAILESFLQAVGYSLSERVLPEAAFKRLVWANAGVPRDFLQMFGRALEHSQRNSHSSVTVSDVNIAIGEFGQKKFQEMRDDARGDVGRIDVMINALDRFCLDINKINAFLLKSEDSEERELVRKLSDLRLVHLIHQSITPDSAGEKYEAFIVDYALFTGFRRRPNVKEMIPSESQFKASELRKLPKVELGFIDKFQSDGFEQRRVKSTVSATAKNVSRRNKEGAGKAQKLGQVTLYPDGKNTASPQSKKSLAKKRASKTTERTLKAAVKRGKPTQK